MGSKMLSHLKIVVETTITLEISDQNPILRLLCTDVDAVVVCNVATSTREISKKKRFIRLMFEKITV